MRKVICLFTLLLCGTFCFAKSVWVSKETKLLDSPSKKAKKTITVYYGTELIVLGSDGDFLQVKVAGKERQTGWIKQSQTSSRKLQTTSSANADEIALAGKGFNAEVEGLYAQNTNADFSPVDKIESFESDSDELDEFMSEGNLQEAE